MNPTKESLDRVWKKTGGEGWYAKKDLAWTKAMSEELGVKPRVVFELDDLCDAHDPYDVLVDLHSKIPQIKVTLFAIPRLCSDEMLGKYKALGWAEIAIHGYHHSSFECWAWTKEEAESKLQETLDRGYFVKGFRAPGWIAHREVYEAIDPMGLWTADHAVHVSTWGNSKGPKYIYNMLGASTGIVPVHGHTLEVCGNGPSWWTKEIEKLADADFAFVSEVVKPFEVDMVQECHTSWGYDSAFGENSKSAMKMFIEGMAPTGMIIDFGGNDGTAAKQAVSMGVPAMVVDSSPSRVFYAINANGIPAVLSELESISLPDGFVDWGFCSHTLEHVNDFEKTWAEIKRVCSKGCFVVVPVEEEEKFAENPAHKRRHTHEEWLEMMGAYPVMKTKDGLWCVWESGLSSGEMKLRSMEAIKRIRNSGIVANDEALCAS